MAMVLQALVLGFHFLHTLQHLIGDITGCTSKIESYDDSKMVFDVIDKDGNTTERRMKIDIAALRESYGNRGLSLLG